MERGGWLPLEHEVGRQNSAFDARTGEAKDPKEKINGPRTQRRRDGGRRNLLCESLFWY